MTKILAIGGSLREMAFTKRVLRIAADAAREAGAEVTTVDLRDYPMAIYDGDDHSRRGFDPHALRFQELAAQHDGFLISTPEYNGSIPGGLKNAIDWASRKSEKYGMVEAFKGKHAAIMTASPGAFGGIRCLAHLRGVLTIMLVHVLPLEIAVSFVAQKFDGDSPEMNDENTLALLRTLGSSLVGEIERSRPGRAGA